MDLEPPHEPEKFFRWIIGFLILAFIIWLLLGGVKRFEEKDEGPFIEPPIAEISAPHEPADDNSGVENAEQSNTQSNGNI